LSGQPDFFQKNKMGRPHEAGDDAQNCCRQELALAPRVDKRQIVFYIPSITPTSLRGFMLEIVVIR
jgi:hypothetical protein